MSWSRPGRSRGKIMTLKVIRFELRACADREKAKFLQRFFKCGPGGYAEGDRFIGVTVPNIRKLVRKYREFPLIGIVRLLQSPIHEERLLALLILTDRMKKAQTRDRKNIFEIYLKYLKHVNNWDLVDLSAGPIVGMYLFERPGGIQESGQRLLDRLASSRRMWDRRVAIMSTFHFIRNGNYSATLRLAQALLDDEEDLIHKAVGWMLREVGNRELETEEAFLRRYFRRMPRTMLRYAIERFPEKNRKSYLRGTVSDKMEKSGGGTR